MAPAGGELPATVTHYKGVGRGEVALFQGFQHLSATKCSEGALFHLAQLRRIFKRRIPGVRLTVVPVHQHRRCGQSRIPDAKIYRTQIIDEVDDAHGKDLKVKAGVLFATSLSGVVGRLTRSSFLLPGDRPGAYAVSGPHPYFAFGEPLLQWPRHL